MHNWNLLNKLGEPEHFTAFLHKFNSFSNTVAGMFNSIYHYTCIKIILKSHFLHDNICIRLCHYVRNIIMDVIK